MTYPPSSWSATFPRRKRLSGLCLILDPEFLEPDPVTAARQALSAGVRFFQYRSKKDSRRSIYETALALSAAIRRQDGIFILNDHADIAAAVGADGVHLGQDDLPLGDARGILGERAIIGISTHDFEQASAAEREGADYVGFGPMFPTSTKDAGPAQGIAALTKITAKVKIPVIAIGGITIGKAGSVMNAGASGIAVISAVCRAPDIAVASADFIKALDGEIRQEVRKNS